MQSRYYDPSLGRFINADAFASTGQGILGNNMFAYCGNNPANKKDIPGTMHAATCVLDGGIPVTTYQIANTPKEQTWGVINGQGTLPYANVAIGFGSYGKSGCQYIAMYNLLQLIGKPQSLESITVEMYDYGAVLGGAGGAGPWAAARFLQNHNIAHVGSFSAEKLAAGITEGSVITFTVMYPTGWHAMTALYINNEYWVFNRYDQEIRHIPFSSISDTVVGGWWIYGIRVDP